MAKTATEKPGTFQRISSALRGGHARGADGKGVKRNSPTTMHVSDTAITGVATYLCLFEQTQPAHRKSVYVIPARHRETVAELADAVPFPGKRGLYGFCAFVLASLRTYYRVRPDVVFFHSTFSMLPMAVLRLCGARAHMIYCSHGWSIVRYTEDRGWKSALVTLVEGHVPRLADTVINISSYEHKLVAGLGYRGNHKLIENAVAPSRVSSGQNAQREEGDDLNLLFVGRFDKQKGADLLLSAMTDIAALRPDIRLTMIGAGEMGELEAAMPPSAQFLGAKPQDEIDRWYASADALIVPSRWEGFGLVVPEALRNGTPALVSDRGALPDLIRAGETGMIFSLEDLPAFLAKLQRKDLLAMREASRRSYYERFDIERWASALHAEVERAGRN
ncbi:glycosyltransferase family 4 protein [Qipengyuania sphaerica]|uniref:glycosyltransferase family 4 protein n=1 Tax=Qipengyuania sphaerica TaxID=2867243 RepID=UPI001C86FCCF|nr:glycosyltransferase family 4 protein [Qipengyuania sphaerica]MBX7540892.1 glycosyltransferase family 4 protein [Qipengyuania sphaerica]